ncbi:MAG: DUF5715 family protein [Bacteroidota bacterium]
MRDLPPAPPALAAPPVRSRTGRRWAWRLVALVVIVGIGVVTARQVLLVREVIVRTDRGLERVEGRLGAIPALSEAEIARLRRSLGAAHVREAQARGIEPVIRRSRLVQTARDQDLVRIESTPRYRVLDATHSVPLATHGVRRALDSLSVRFWDDLASRGLPGFRFTISSMLRSAEDQAALARVNVNAARERSSHEFGTTFDLTYRRFSFRGGPEPDMARLPPDLAPVVRGQVRGYLQRRRAEAYRAMAERRASALAASLGRALIALEDEGVLIALREERQPVYHITSLLDAPSGSN